mmetsp:Transcript_8409/g.17112  ORF Transcript_8409/g.17112 Transcript_8409/m.17112 type:complete len:287 (-) Transcript_8409:188-1048(-)|eukprot:CAMPEP_0184681178 /NCGR_PEP_ID=MMETSP0312-20130426/4132_1 /TAXON_ID=31354 /ORGANISM="Compsopogon coeruleus, Strain SAG 36.94" /LENGTH=286 /DNA_ID=CAMNT_0027131837 /DNA_START=81 /DNA_END=941 /DNA_ORIENTATION=-
MKDSRSFKECGDGVGHVEEVQVEQIRGLGVVLRLNRRQARNALTARMYLRCAEVLERANDDVDVSMVVMTGNAGSFTSGTDLVEAREALTLDGTGQTEEKQPWWRRPVGRFMRALLRCTKLVVAAVDGDAVGIGLTMLIHCDVVYATERSRFWVPFAEVGLVPEFSSSQELGRVVGATLARDLLLTGRILSAEEAKGCGLVTRLWVNKASNTRDFLSSVVDDMKSTMRKLPREAITLTKKQLRPDEWIQKIEAIILKEFEEIGRLGRSGYTENAIQQVIFRRSARL